MKTIRAFTLLFPVLGGLAFAQSSPGVNAPRVEPIGETTLTLDIGFGVRAVPASRVTVPLGEKVRIIAPSIGEGFRHAWTRNGQPIVGAPTTSVLTLERVAASDSGVYAVEMMSSTAGPFPSQALVLGVGPTDRLINLSTRGEVGAGPGQALTAGFVVTTAGAEKRLIVRAIGPSLSLFGVTNPLRAPVLRIYDSRGQLYTNGYVYLPVVGGLTYEQDLAASLARAGAFPLPAGSRDVVVMMPFLPGAYTAQITSGDGVGGAALVEVYEVP